MTAASQPLPGSLQAALESALQWIERNQRPDGHWVGRLESNCCMEAQWVLALHVLGLKDHPIVPRLAQAIRQEQRDDGSWEVFRNAPGGDINTTVECYVALRAIGASAEEPALEAARQWILDRGGLSKVRVFTRYWLALVGVWPWTQTPNLPPEIIHAPRWFPFNIYHFASWARATLLPLSILSAHRPVVPLCGDDRLEELFPDGRERFDWSLPRPPGRFTWERFFLSLDRWLHRVQSWKLIPFRRAALERATEWIVRHQDADGVWGGIQPPWVYSLLALWVMGYSKEHPVMAKGLGALDDPRWRVDVADATFVSASVSPVWDTLLTLMALQDTGHVATQNFERGIRWILSKEVLHPGDWAQRRQRLPPGGWAFEYENRYYPDIDDTAVALSVLARCARDPRLSEDVQGPMRRATEWILGMQCKNGGWAAFDVDNDHSFLTRIPFCDFGEVLDPPSVDVTAHVLEALGLLGHSAAEPAVRAGIAFIQREQEADGSWFGRWGVNHVYGTSAVLSAAPALDLDLGGTWLQRGADWLVQHQNPDGGWGESCISYMDAESVGRGVSTPSQTAWALMGLCALARPADRPAVERGVQWLVAHQRDGTWPEAEYTGTGFPGYGVGLKVKLDDPRITERLAQGVELSRAFMISYHLYRHYFPVMALARARAWLHP